MIDGEISHVGTVSAVLANAVILGGPVDFASPRYLVRVVAFLDGLGPSDAPQMLRGVIYRNGELVIAGDTLVVENGQTPAWVPLTFTGFDGLELAPGGYQFGFHASETSLGSQAIVLASAHSAANVYSPESFPGGAPASLPAATSTLTGPLAMYLETLEAFNVPVDVLTDDYLATLPFPLAQRVFSATAPLPQTLVTATAGWYGSAFDSTPQCSNAVVNMASPLVTLLGERIQVKLAAPNATRTVVVYVHDQQEFPDEIASQDLLLSERAFTAIANWADDEILVNVQVMA